MGKKTSVTGHTNKYDLTTIETSPSKDSPAYDAIELQNYHGVDQAGYSRPFQDTEAEKVSLWGLFRFADCIDYTLMLVGFLTAAANGVATQITYLLMGNVMDDFIFLAGSLNGSDVNQALLDLVPTIAIQFSSVAVATLIFGYIHMTCWNMTAERQTKVMREAAFENILRQHMGYFDTHKGGELNTRLTEDVATYQGGMGDKMATAIQWISTFLGGAIICLARGWQLTLVLLAVAPVAGIMGFIISKVQQTMAGKEMTAYAAAGAIAEEVLTAIRTVAAFGGEEKEALRYETCLVAARKVGIIKGMVSGIGQGIVWLIAFSVVGLAFWYGGFLVRDGIITGGFVLQVQFSMFTGMRSLGWSVTSVEAISAARGAAAGIYKLIDAESEIDSSDNGGIKPEKCAGNIVFQNIHFVYPSRTDVTVLQGLTLEIKQGQTAALVGPSGCGKSTTIQLLQRQYDPQFGSVLVDGIEVRALNIKWLRDQIGVVSQEPVLFAATIGENIRFGREDCTMEEIYTAAVEANVHDFIRKLPKQYDTMMTEMGTALSKGQKQRICLARALVRQPKMLLLDEATSALDNESEAIVQDALEKASKGRTTLIIAHRLSTVRNADVLFVVDKGVVAEKGTHEELMAMHGVYFGLVSKQLQAGKDQEEKERKKLLEGISEDDIDLELDNEFVKKDPALEIIKSRARTQSMSSKKGRSATVISTSSFGDKYEEELDNDVLPEPEFGRLFGYSRPEACLLVVAGIAAFLQGGIFPALAVLFTEVLAAFSIEDHQEQMDTINFWVMIIIITGVCSAVFTLCMVYLFTLCGEKLTYRLRCLAFRTMLRQEIGWFDEKKNQVGALTSKLANDASRVKGAIGSHLCTIVNASSTALLSLVIGFVFGWMLAIVITAILPLIILIGVSQTRLLTGFAQISQSAIENGGKIISEAIDKIKTVCSLTKEPYFLHKYTVFFEAMFKEGKKRAHVFGVTWGLSQGLTFFTYAVAMAFGGYLVGMGHMEFKNVFRVFIAIAAGGVEIGRVNAFASDYSKAKVAAAKLFALFDRKSLIDPYDPSGATPAICEGSIGFEDVRFAYPVRPNVQVLRGFNMHCKRGQFIAFVGSSGSGKSTALQLLERFYDIATGVVTLDSVNVKELNIQWLRRQMAVVSQEPILFATSMKENIAYGDNSRQVTMDEIIAAAKGANIHNFITSLPQGYETNVGSKGAQLSGGQKQRVAIARALMRNPKIILLDDATSALDSESERVVQEALEKAQTGRTSIVIAHRLSTIVAADMIFYVEKGRIVEKGTHGELMNLKGYYFKLQQMYLGNREQTS